MTDSHTTAEPKTNTQGSRSERPTGVLTKADIIKNNLITGKTKEHEIDNFKDDQKCYQLSCYDLRVGREYIIFGDSQQFPGKKGDGGTITIPAFGAALISSYEMIVTPRNIVGRFNVRFKAALKGIIVQMGTQIEPNYSGFLFAIVQNITNRDIELKVGEERLFTIEFYYTSKLCENNGHKYIYRIEALRDLMGFEKTLNHFKAGIERNTVDTREISEQASLASLKATSASNEATKASNEATKASKEAKDASNNSRMIATSIALVVIVPVLWTISMPYVYENAAISSDTKTIILTTPKLVDSIKYQVEFYKATVDSVRSTVESLKDHVDNLEKQSRQTDSSSRSDFYDLRLGGLLERAHAADERVGQLEREIFDLKLELQVLKTKQENQPTTAAPTPNAKAPAKR